MTPPKMETFDRLTAGEPMRDSSTRYAIAREAKRQGGITNAELDEARRRFDEDFVEKPVPTPRDKSEIDVALDLMSAELLGLQSSYRELEQRLTPIMGPETDSPVNMEAAPSTCWMTVSLIERTREIRIATRRLQSILERLAI